VSSSGDLKNLKRKKPLKTGSRMSISSGKKGGRGSDSDLLDDTDEDIDVGKLRYVYTYLVLCTYVLRLKHEYI
jgi:hypothetical protein